METRRLGAAGPAVSRLALGAMTFAAEADEKASRELLDVFVEGGGTLVDTADTYQDGRSEEIIGRWLADRAGAAPTAPGRSWTSCGRWRPATA